MDHGFSGCPCASKSLEWILKWCHIHVRHFTNVIELLKFVALWDNCRRKWLTLSMIIKCFLWYMWNTKNKRVFKGICYSPVKIADEVILLSFIWYKKEERVINVSGWNGVLLLLIVCNCLLFLVFLCA